MNEELLDVGLPKWPQMIVWGESITTDQAFNEAVGQLHPEKTA